MNREQLVDRIAAAILASEQQPWQISAACAGSPEQMDATRSPEVLTGLALCAQCPVLTQCRAWADEETDYVGIAGGQVYTSRHGASRRVSTVHRIATPA